MYQENTGAMETDRLLLRGDTKAGAKGAAGLGGAPQTAFNKRLGVPFGRTFKRFGDAFIFIAFSISAGVAAGCASRYSAAVPVTCGVAMDVPDKYCVAESEMNQSDFIDKPGAKTSTIGP